ncbi:hypothetical protein ABN197_06000, partial [Providencia alcalifaciens]
ISTPAIAGFFISKLQSNQMQIIGYVLLLVMHGSAEPVTEKIYTKQECEGREVQLMQVRDVEIVCREVMRE